MLFLVCNTPDGITSISSCIFNHHNLFYQIQNALAFNRDTCCHLALCLQLLPFHWTCLLSLSIHLPTSLLCKKGWFDLKWLFLLHLSYVHKCLWTTNICAFVYDLLANYTKGDWNSKISFKYPQMNGIEMFFILLQRTSTMLERYFSYHLLLRQFQFLKWD
jgi:hypothetical protein